VGGAVGSGTPAGSDTKEVKAAPGQRVDAFASAAPAFAAMAAAPPPAWAQGRKRFGQFASASL